MIKAIAAPKLKYPQLAVVPYAYAATLVALAVLTLMGIGGFDFAGIAYTTPGTPELAITVAALLIYSLPFVLRLPLSQLARFCSATFSLVVPFFMVTTLAYLNAQGVVDLNATALLSAGLFVVLGVTSFVVLDGPRALQLKR